MQNISSRETGSQPADNPALRWFALITAAATFVLVWIGGLVTSHDAGMTVPDWPTTYGYNMFFFPISKWFGGIFYEHTHRLVASGVGLLTTILALWLFGRKSHPLLRWGGILFLVAGLLLLFVNPQSAIRNPQLPTVSHIGEDIMLACIGLVALASSFVWPNCEPSPKWLRTLGVIAFFAVVIQGVLGGLRVTMLKDQLGIFHATLAQLFFVLVSAIALFQTKFWRELPSHEGSDAKGLRFLFLGTSILILCQLMLGATMRHQHAGLAIPDFPAAYGKLWPNTDPASVLKYNQLRFGEEDPNYITAFQIILQMVHRLMAGIIFLSVAACAWLARRQFGPSHRLSRLTVVWTFLIAAQVLLGAATIWTGKSADIATAHVACGALSLVAGSMILLISFRCLTAAARIKCAEQRNELTTLLPSSSIVR